MSVTPGPRAAATSRRAARAVALAGLLASLLTASSSCTTPEEHEADADDQVYAIIRDRRDRLAAGDPFDLIRPQDTLRDRMLAGEAPEPLGLEDLLVAAAENSREFQDRRESLFLSALDLTLEQWRFDVQSAGFFDLFREGVGGDQGLGGLLSSVTFSRLFASGMQVVAGAGLDLLVDSPGGSGWDAVSHASLDITQPLLRGFGSEIVREPLTQAERDVLYEARTYERFRRTFAFDVTSRFFAILRVLDTLENEQEAEKRVRTLRERNEAFAEAGQLNEIQVDQARQDELRARNRVVEAQRDVSTAYDDFKFFLGLPIGSELPLQIEGYLELGRWDFLDLEPTEEQVVELALARRLDHLTAVERAEDAARRVVVARDALRAGLDLAVRGDVESPLGDAGSIALDDTQWRVDLLLDLPIDRLPERNAYRASLIDLEQARRDVEASGDRIATDVREDLRFLQAARESYEIQRNAVTLAERRVESSELQLEAGRVDTRDVLESQEALLEARNGLTAALIEFVLSGLALYRDMELVVVEPGGYRVDTSPLLADDEGAATSPSAPPPEDTP